MRRFHEVVSPRPASCFAEFTSRQNGLDKATSSSSPNGLGAVPKRRRPPCDQRDGAESHPKTSVSGNDGEPLLGPRPYRDSFRERRRFEFLFGGGKKDTKSGEIPVKI